MRRYLIILPLLLAVFAFAACGSDSSSSDESAATATETATEAPTDAATAAPTEAATEAPTDPAASSGDASKGDAGVKVSGALGSAPKITVPSGGTAPTKLTIKDIKVGTGPKAVAGQTVDMQYSGVLFKDGTKFDASWDRGGEPFSFSLGAGMVIPGWDQGIVGMQKGGRRLLIIPPDLGYGPTGSGPIPPDSTLVFVVDLDAIKAP